MASFFYRTSLSAFPLETKKVNRNSKLLRRQTHSHHRDPSPKLVMEGVEEAGRRDSLTLTMRTSCASVVKEVLAVRK